MQIVQQRQANLNIVIGGFALNDQPLAGLAQQTVINQFIDINSFKAQLDFTNIVQHIAEILNTYSQAVNLIGFSSGGLVAIELAHKMPQLVKRLVLINSSPCFMSKADWHGIPPENYYRLVNKLSSLSLEQFKHHFSCLVMHPLQFSPKDLFKLQSEFCTKAGLANWLEILFTSDLRQQFAQLKQPLLYLNSEYDHLVPHINKLDNLHLTQYTLKNSSHAKLDDTELTYQLKRFFYECPESAD